MTADEARAEAEAGGQDVLGVEQAIRGRVTSVLGGDDTAERAVGGTQAKLINAIGRVDHAKQAAAELRKLDERGQLTTDVLAQVLRNLRQQAENEVLRLYPDATRDELAEHTHQLSDQWFIHLRTTWDAAVVGSGRTFSQVLDRGSQVDVDYKRTLYMASGQLSDVDELVLALRGDRKDLETVKRVLRNKTREQIDELKRQYKIKTTTADNKWGGSLDEDLLGFSPPKARRKAPTGCWSRTTCVGSMPKEARRKSTTSSAEPNESTRTRSRTAAPPDGGVITGATRPGPCSTQRCGRCERSASSTTH